MKQFIVLCSMILLGVVIYQMIAGPADDSMINVVGEVWKQGISVRTPTP